MLNKDYFSIDAKNLKGMVENGYTKEVSIYLNETNKYIRTMTKEEVVNEGADIRNFFEEVYDVFTEDLFDVFSEVLNDEKYRVYRIFALGAKACAKYVASK